MSGDNLIEAVKNNQPEKVVFLLDEQNVDVNSADSAVNFVFFSQVHFYCFFCN